MSVNNNIHVHDAKELKITKSKTGGYIVSTVCDGGYVDFYIHDNHGKLRLNVDLRDYDDE